MAQTAVDYLVKKFHDYGTLYYSDITEAKAMEKEQIMNAFANGIDQLGYVTFDIHGKPLWIDESETYYNKTYTNGL
jgi:hypothetical protein